MAAHRILSETVSLCPVCLARLSAKRTVCDDDIYLEKTCPEHGSFRTVIWRGAESYYQWGAQASATGQDVSPDCPFACGLCAAHKQQSCCVLLNVTQRCNLKCPVCFASAGEQSSPEPDLTMIEDWFCLLLAKGGPFNIQLSGGEPTLRDDLPAIIELGQKLGFSFIQLNTNGIRLAMEAGYAESLKQAGLSCVFLQFDGTTDAIYQILRGAPLWRLKQKAIEECAAAGLGIVLTPTLKPGVNVSDIGNIIRFAVRQAPAVRGVHFQPISYFGRYPQHPAEQDRLTVPDVLREIERQTGGLAKVADFSPSCGTNVFCSFHANYLLSDSGEWRRQRRKASASGGGPDNAARRAQAAVARRWSGADAAAANAGNASCCCGNTDSLDQFLQEMSRRSFFLSGMAFQDVWNLDLARLQECYVHVVSPDKRLIPFCAYNCTSIEGNPLYRWGADG